MAPPPPMPVPERDIVRRRRARTLADTALWSLIFLPITGTAVWLVTESTKPAACDQYHDIRAIAHWFDPSFFQYNLLLSLVAILIVPVVPLPSCRSRRAAPVVPLIYTRAVAWRKAARLQDELPPAEWLRVRPRFERRGEARFFWASALLATLMVTMGVTVIALFKPLAGPGCGVNFAKGANMLLLGPYLTAGWPHTAEAVTALYAHLMHAQVGFQFGFLGAYIYFLGAMSRAFFTLDLTPETFIEGSLRIAIASVLPLVLSFALEPSSSNAGSPIAGLTTPQSPLPAISFFFGFFPSRALAFLENLISGLAHNLLPADENKVMPLRLPHGLNFNHELRLEREGFDSVENFSHADAAALAVRTGFSNAQLRQWISEAALMARLREDYPKFVSQTGLSSIEEVTRFMAGIPDPDTALTALAGTGENAVLLHTL